MCGQVQIVLVSVKLPRFRLKPPGLGTFKLFVTDKAEVLSIQTCLLEAPFSTGNEIANDLKYELYELHCSSHLLGTFEKLLKGLLASSCLSVRLSAWNNSAPNGWIFMKFGI